MTRRPVRYAERFPIRVHPSLHRTAVGVVLRDLAADGRYPTIAQLAREALVNGPHILPVLADELEGADHPKKDDYNWRAVPRGLAIDESVGRAAREIAGLNRYTAGNHISNAWLHSSGWVGQAGPAALERRRQSHDHILARVSADFPDLDRDEFNESLERIATHNQSFSRDMPGYPVLGRQRHFRWESRLPVEKGAGALPLPLSGLTHRFFKTQVKLARRGRPVRYAVIPGSRTPTVTVNVPVPTPVSSQPRRQPQSVPRQPQQPTAPRPPQGPGFRREPFVSPRTIIFSHTPRGTGVNVPGSPNRMGRARRYARARSEWEPVIAKVLHERSNWPGEGQYPLALQIAGDFFDDAGDFRGRILRDHGRFNTGEEKPHPYEAIFGDRGGSYLLHRSIDIDPQDRGEGFLSVRAEQNNPNYNERLQDRNFDHVARAVNFLWRPPMRHGGFESFQTWMTPEDARRYADEIAQSHPHVGNAVHNFLDRVRVPGPERLSRRTTRTSRRVSR